METRGNLEGFTTFEQILLENNSRFVRLKQYNLSPYQGAKFINNKKQFETRTCKLKMAHLYNARF